MVSFNSKLLTLNSKLFVAPQAGFEPAAVGLTVRRSTC